MGLCQECVSEEKKGKEVGSECMGVVIVMNHGV